jgi:serine/threonine protein kinase
MSTWTLTAGDTLASAHIVRRLGGGSEHEAFLVETGGRRAVAKVPRPHLVDDPHCLIRLRDEGRALQHLAHPALPLHLGTVLSGPHPHVLLEYVPGPTLRAAVLARMRLPEPVVASLGAALARALAHIAAAGWVHLDVKPSNIMLNPRPRLIDFELARPVADAARITQPGGTWAYMPPEQRRARGIGPPADVFSLAASLHEALAGRVLTSPAVPNAATLRGPVGALLSDALAPDPADRPTATQLAHALSDWADDAAQGLCSGRAAATVVPLPGGLSTRSSPFIAATRS